MDTEHGSALQKLQTTPFSLFRLAVPKILIFTLFFSNIKFGDSATSRLDWSLFLKVFNTRIFTMPYGKFLSYGIINLVRTQNFQKN